MRQQGKNDNTDKMRTSVPCLRHKKVPPVDLYDRKWRRDMREQILMKGSRGKLTL